MEGKCKGKLSTVDCNIFALTGRQQNVHRVAVVDQYQLILFMFMSLSIWWVCSLASLMVSAV